MRMSTAATYPPEEARQWKVRASGLSLALVPSPVGHIDKRVLQLTNIALALLIENR